MSEFPESEQAAASRPEVPESAPGGKTWFQRLTSVLFIIFCFELGLFLLIYPWTDGWSENYFAWLLQRPAWHAFWDNSYVRGGLSGLGIANLWIAIMEVFHMFSRPQATDINRHE
jgi:hypothetical protein